MSPSVYKKPTASSLSYPGVRIVTATLRVPCPGPCTRISNGSSAASQSVRSRTTASRMESTWVAAAPSRWRNCLFIHGREKGATLLVRENTQSLLIMLVQHNVEQKNLLLRKRLLKLFLHS